ncbi:futalosine hydrolase [Desulfoplanes sp. PS50]
MLALIFATARESRACLGSAHVTIKEGQWANITVHDRPCLQVITGIGPINAALVFGKLLATFPDLEGVLSLGIGGSFDLQEVDLGGWAVASQEIWPEIGIKSKECVHVQALGFPQGQAGNDAIWDRVTIDSDHNATAMGISIPKSMVRVPFITVAGVTSTEERRLFLQTIYQCGIENMEGFSLALACATHELPFLEIRTVSNQVGPRDKATWRIDKAFDRLGKVIPALFATTIPEKQV